MLYIFPQFHKIKENSLWWGEGYTDWVAAKNAKPLFDGHYQPHVPLNYNYYDLTDRKVMEWQVSLVREYSVDGFCFYHYWFQDRKRILEKPVENLLNWKDIPISFFFSWANASWTVMSTGKMNTQGNAVLLDEKYGLQADWVEHFSLISLRTTGT